MNRNLSGRKYSLHPGVHVWTPPSVSQKELAESDTLPSTVHGLKRKYMTDIKLKESMISRLQEELSALREPPETEDIQDEVSEKRMSKKQKKTLDGLMALQINTLRTNLEVCEKKLEHAGAVEKQLVDSAEKARAKLRESEKERVDLEAILRDREDELVFVVDKAQEKTSTYEKELEELRVQYKANLEEIESLKGTVEEIRTGAKASREVEEKISSLLSRNSQKDAIIVRLEEKIQDLEMKNTQKEAMIERLEGKVKHMEADAKDAHVATTHIQRQMSLMMSKEQLLQKQLRDKVSTIELYHHRCSKLQESVSKMEQAKRDKIPPSQKLIIAELDNYKKKLEEAEKKSREQQEVITQKDQVIKRQTNVSLLFCLFVCLE